MSNKPTDSEASSAREVPIRQIRAVAEVGVLAGIYILVSTQAVAVIDASSLFPLAWLDIERATGSGFLVGAMVQLILVLIGAYILNLRHMRYAIAASLLPSSAKAWSIAAVATAIHIGTAILFILPQRERVWEWSGLNWWLSVVPAADGWSQEVMFRGYVLLRLASASIPVPVQIFISGILFAAIHIGYLGDTALDVASPLVGTFMLGCFYAYSVTQGGGSLKPVICCHMLIIVVLQPWLALAL